MAHTENIDNQNIDTSIENPLTLSDNTNQNVSQINYQELLNQPKYKILLLLSVLLVILLILSIVALIFKKKPTTISSAPTPTIILPTPTIDQSNIPEKWVTRLQDRDTETKLDETFMPPQIDTTIGL